MSTTALSDIAPQRLVCEEAERGIPRRNMDNGGGKRTEFIIVVVIIVSLASFIVAIVGIAKSGHLEVEYEQEFEAPPIGIGAPRDKIWTFAIGHYDVNLEYLDKVSGTIKGYNVDVVNAVCKIASKNCEIIYDDYHNCWQSTAGAQMVGGEGLLGGWYDACTGWGITYDRARVFSFTKPYSKLPAIGIFVANDTTDFDWNDLTNRKVGFVEGFSSNTDCLARYVDLIEGAVLPETGNQIMYYSTVDELAAAVIDGSVDAAFCYAEPQMGRLKRLTDDSFPNHCALGGYGMMARKDRVDFFSWWNNAFDKLIKTTEYRMICEDLKKAHGHIPGRNPNEVCYE